MKYIKQGSVNSIVLAYFFAKAQTEDFTLTEDHLISDFAGKIGTIRIQMALEQLKDSDYVEDVEPSNSDYVFALSKEGYSRAEKFYLENDKGIVRQIVDLGLDAYLQLREEEADSGTEADIPASDRLVTVSDNMAGYGEIIGSMESADEVIRGANDLDAEERSWIRIHLELGIALLKKGGKVLHSALKSLLLEPLEAALKDSSQDNLRKAVEVALKALRTYLGIF